LKPRSGSFDAQGDIARDAIGIGVTEQEGWPLREQAGAHAQFDPRRQVFKAAALDGASRVAVFRFVLLPLVAPGMASAALLTFLASWNEFLFAYTFTAAGASRTVPVALALFPGIFEVPWGDIAAASILASLPPILLVAVLQRYLIRGLLAGALRE
jgi:multiple sugar transport system permease protein